MSRLRYILLSVLVVNIFTNYKCIANHNVKSIAVGNALDSRCQLNLSKIAQSVEHIPLDDGGVVDGLLIDEKNLSLKVSDSGDLFIFQRQRGQDILKIFSSTGQFKSSRISYGRGPGEFMNGVKSVAEFDNTLVLLDYCNAIVYRDGEFSRSVRLWDFYPGGCFLCNIELLDNDSMLVLYDYKNEGRVSIFDLVNNRIIEDKVIGNTKAGRA